MPDALPQGRVRHRHRAPHAAREAHDMGGAGRHLARSCRAGRRRAACLRTRRASRPAPARRAGAPVLALRRSEDRAGWRIAVREIEGGRVSALMLRAASRAGASSPRRVGWAASGGARLRPGARGSTSRPASPRRSPAPASRWRWRRVPAGIVSVITPVDETSSACFFFRVRRAQGWQRDAWRFLYRTGLELRHRQVLEQDREMLDGCGLGQLHQVVGVRPCDRRSAASPRWRRIGAAAAAALA